MHAALHAPFKFICHCGIRYYRFAEFKGHRKLVHNEIVTKEEDTFNIESDEETEEKTESKHEIDYEMESKVKLVDAIQLGDATIKTKHGVFPRSKATLKVKGNKRNTKKKTRRKVNNGNFKAYQPQPAQCPVCNKTFKDKHYLKRHEVVHMKEKPFLCNVCGKRFAQSGSLNLHSKRHNGIKEFQCQYCPKAFYSIAAMSLHERTHTGYKPYSCDVCPKQFSDPSAFARHKRTHTGERKFKCDMCSKSFTENAALRRHKILKHDRNKAINCQLCFRSFGLAIDLRHHVEDYHGDQKKEKKLYSYECDYCDKKCTYKYNLNGHIRRKHMECRIRHPCHLCTSQFNDKHYLKIHLKDVHGTGEYVCDYCGEVCKSKNKVKIHINMKHSIELFCHICKKRFIRAGDLRLHRKQGCKENKCDLCGKICMGKSNLKRHIKILHCGYKIECHHCGAKYSTRQMLKRHLNKDHYQEF